jgi:pyrimidine-nucleoside phosphorylase
MLVAAGKAADPKVARAALLQALRTGAGLETLRRMIEAQGGDPRVVDDPSLLPQAAHRVPAPAGRSGYVTSMDTVSIGRAAQMLGAGRVTKDDVIDPAVGLVMRVRVGDRVEAGQPLATLHANDSARIGGASDVLLRAVVVGDAPAEPSKLLRAVVTPEGVAYM